MFDIQLWKEGELIAIMILELVYVIFVVLALEEDSMIFLKGLLAYVEYLT